MIFGTTAFASAPFSSQFIQNATILPTGQQLNISIGNVTVIPQIPVSVTGNTFNLATNPVSVITWNAIPPGVNQVWTPIDPDA